MTITATERIARLNDRCRQGLDANARIMVTRNCLARLSGEGEGIAEILAQAELLAAVRRYAFKPGAFDLQGQRVLFKIDYYDMALEFGSDDPADASITRRVLTVMLAEDY
jgi:hypothetical protein